MAQASTNIAVKVNVTDDTDLQRLLVNMLEVLPRGPVLFDTVCYAVKKLRRTHQLNFKPTTIMTACLIAYQRIGKKLPKADDKLSLEQLVEKYKINA
jgi:hypothetical protein